MKDSMTITISTLEEALDFLSYYEADQESAPDVVFAGEINLLRAGIEGNRYHSTIPGELARGLWEFQEAMYKAVAFALYEVEDIRKLTAAQRRDFELVFKVSEGSTDLAAMLEGFFKKLGEGFLTMDSKHKAYTLVAIAAIVGASLAASKIIEINAAVRTEEVKAQLNISLEAEKTKQFEVFGRVANGSPVTSKFSKAVEDGSRAIVRSVPDAESVKIGRVKLDRVDIEEVNQRAVKEKASADILTEDFVIFGTQSRDSGFTKYLLARRDGSEFYVTVSHEEHKPEDLDKIWAAARDRKPIALEINATFIRGVVRSAQIVKVI